MPIKNLELRSRLPRLGKIKLGIKKTAGSGKQYPAEVPYFVLPSELIDRDPERFGKQPTVLDVMFPSDDPTFVLEVWYLRYQGSGGPQGGVLTLRCDGETAQEFPLTSKTVEIRPMMILNLSADYGGADGISAALFSVKFMEVSKNPT